MLKSRSRKAVHDRLTVVVVVRGVACELPEDFTSELATLFHVQTFLTLTYEKPLDLPPPWDGHDPRTPPSLVRHFLDRHREWIVEDEGLAWMLKFKAHGLLTDRSIPEGRAFFGSLFFEGVLVERSFVAAAMWICEGYVFGAETGRAWCDWLNTRTPAQRRAGLAHVDSGDVPEMLWTRPK